MRPPVVLEREMRYIRTMIVSLIAAASDNDVIGRKNALPWHLPAELKHFREVTGGKPVIMGRKTAESIEHIGRLPLPGRHNIVITRDSSWQEKGVSVAATIEEALEIAGRDKPEEAFVIGGGQVYEAAMPLADRVWLTRVHKTIEDGEAFFPPMNESEWDATVKEDRPVDAENPIAYTITRFDRKN